MLHILRVRLQQDLEAGMGADGVEERSSIAVEPRMSTNMKTAYNSWARRYLPRLRVGTDPFASTPPPREGSRTFPRQWRRLSARGDLEVTNC
jgi:hypothetical protein